MPDDPLELFGAGRDEEQRERSAGRIRHVIRAEAGDLFGLDLGKQEDRDTLRDMVRWYRDEDRREAVSAIVKWWNARQKLRQDFREKGWLAAWGAVVVAIVTFLINRYGKYL